MKNSIDFKSIIEYYTEKRYNETQWCIENKETGYELWFSIVRHENAILFKNGDKILGVIKIDSNYSNRKFSEEVHRKFGLTEGITSVTVCTSDTSFSFEVLITKGYNQCSSCATANQLGVRLASLSAYTCKKSGLFLFKNGVCSGYKLEGWLS
ncbi:MAG: hypothetical protein ACRCZ0_06200 [Cetobacterium sp.]